MAKKGEARVTFVAETKEFTQGITKINKSLANLRSDLKLCNSELKANGDSFETLTKKQKTLQDAIGENADKIDLLRKKLEKCKDTLGENSDEYNKLYRTLNKAQTEQVQFQRELKDTEKALDNLGDSAKDTAKDIDKLNDKMDNSGGFMEGFADAFNSADVSAVGLGTALGNLASGAISLCIDAISEFCQYLWELPEATQEFRMQMAKLSGATQQYGYDMEFTNELVKEMYGYLGDEQMAVNAITNLQGMGLAQSDLTNTLNSCIAVWTAYGDSIPIESLTESVNETAQVGKVTGVLADALNWAGISEDEFNKKLEACKTTQERATLITQTLNDAYGDSKTKFDQATAGMREAEEASYDLMQAEAELAEQIEPLTTKFTVLKSEGLANITPVLGDVADSLLEIIDAIEGFKKTNVGEMFSDLGKGFMDFMIWIDELWAGLKKLYEIFEPLFKMLGELVKYIGDFYSVIKDGGSVMEAFEYANSRAWTTTKEEMIEAGKVSESAYNNMKKQAENCGDGIGDAMEEGTERSKRSFQEFKDDAKSDMDEVGNHKVTLNKPDTSQTEQALNDSVNKNKKKAGELSTYKYDLNKPNTSQAEQTLASSVDKNKKKTSELSTYKYELASPDTTKANGGVATAISAIRTKLGNLGGSSWNIPSPNKDVNVSGAIGDIRGKLQSTSFGVKVNGDMTSLKDSTGTKTKTVQGNMTSVKDNTGTITKKVQGVMSSISDITGTITKKVQGVMSSIKSWFYQGGIINWNASGGLAEGMIVTQPTVFNTPLGLQGVGDRYKGMGSNAEAILPLDSFYRHLDDKLDNMTTGNIVNINFSNVHLHDNLDITKLSEQLAFELRRKTRF